MAQSGASFEALPNRSPVGTLTGAGDPSRSSLVRTSGELLDGAGKVPARDRASVCEPTTSCGAQRMWSCSAMRSGVSGSGADASSVGRAIVLERQPLHGGRVLPGRFS